MFDRTVPLKDNVCHMSSVTGCIYDTDVIPWKMSLHHQLFDPWVLHKILSRKASSVLFLFCQIAVFKVTNSPRYKRDSVIFNPNLIFVKLDTFYSMEPTSVYLHTSYLRVIKSVVDCQTSLNFLLNHLFVYIQYKSIKSDLKKIICIFPYKMTEAPEGRMAGQTVKKSFQ